MMRNLVEYPVTKQEILNYLNDLKQQVWSQYMANISYGDMTLTILGEVIRIVEEKQDYKFDILEQRMDNNQPIINQEGRIQLSPSNIPILEEK